MASADVQFAPNFVHDLEAQMAANAEIFAAAIRMGMTVVGLQVGTKLIGFTYDRVKKLWKPDAELGILALKEWQPPNGVDADELRSTKRALGFEDIVFTPESEKQQPQQQQQQLQVGLQQPRPQVPVAQQKERLEIGQQMIPVNDHNDNHDHNDHHHHDNDNDTTRGGGTVLDQIEHQKYLQRVQVAKHVGCTVWNNDPCPSDRPEPTAMAPNERQELMTMIQQLQTQVAQLTANANGYIANANGCIISTTINKRGQHPNANAQEYSHA